MRGKIMSRLVAILTASLLLAGPTVAEQNGVMSKDKIIEGLKPAGAPAIPGIRTRSVELTTATPVASAAKVALTVNFGLNSAALTDQARLQLTELASALTSPELRQFNFEISGHTDRSGSAELNRALSQRRAEAVVSYLVGQHGVGKTRLSSVGKGFEELANTADPFAPDNRRVEVKTIQP